MQKDMDINPTLCYPYMVSNDYPDHVPQCDVRSKIMNVRSKYLIKLVDTLDNKDYI